MALSLPFASWSGAYPQAPKEQLVMWQKLTGLSPYTHHNILASLFVQVRTALLLT